MNTELPLTQHLHAFDEELSRQFGPYCAHAWLSVLVALTGRTVLPVSARMVVGPSDIQDAIATLIIDVLGDRRAIYLARSTDSGLLSLQSFLDKGLVCLVHDEFPTERRARDILFRLIQHRPIRVLDGSPTGRPRDRHVSAIPACLITRGDACEDGPTLDQLLTIRIDPTGATVTHLARRSLARWKGSENYNSHAMAAFRDLIDRVDWTSTLHPPKGTEAVAEAIDDAADIHRFNTVFSLAATWHRLQRSSTGTSSEAELTLDDIEAVIKLLRVAGVPAHRTRLARPVTDCLIGLQRIRPHLIRKQIAGATRDNRGALHESSRKEGTEPTGPFDFYNVQNTSAFRGWSVSAIREWYRALENAGLLEEQGKNGRKHTFDLTDRGKEWKPGRLADDVQTLLEPLWKDAEV